jgi:hypothetical protein
VAWFGACLVELWAVGVLSSIHCERVIDDVETSVVLVASVAGQGAINVQFGRHGFPGPPVVRLWPICCQRPGSVPVVYTGEGTPAASATTPCLFARRDLLFKLALSYVSSFPQLISTARHVRTK